MWNSLKQNLAMNVYNYALSTVGSIAAAGWTLTWVGTCGMCFQTHTPHKGSFMVVEFGWNSMADYI